MPALFAALLSLLAALVWPLPQAASVSVAAHMMQVLVLLDVAPPLFAIALGPRNVPWPCWVGALAYALVLWGWHAPAAFRASVLDPGPGWPTMLAAWFTAAFFLLLTVKLVVPALVCGIIALVWWAGRQLAADAHWRMRLRLVLAALAAALACELAGQRATGLSPVDSSYGAMVYMTAALQGLFVATLGVMALYTLARSL